MSHAITIIYYTVKADNNEKPSTFFFLYIKKKDKNKQHQLGMNTPLSLCYLRT
jgi:hypothetical protein